MNNLSKHKTITLIMRLSFLQLILVGVFVVVANARVTGAQDLLDKKITLNLENVTLHKALETIELQTKIRFAYSSSLIPLAEKVNIKANNQPLVDVLNDLFTDLNIEYQPVKGQIMLKRIRKKALSDEIPKISTENLPLESQAMELLVRGKITDESGNALPGVNVVVKGTQRGVTSGIEGDYEITLNDNENTLLFSFVGYLSQEVNVDNRTAINIMLQPDQKSLEEVVVIGYGTVKKSDLTGSVAQVKSKEINAFPNANVLQALSGRAPGVHIRQSSGAPGAGISVRVRGGNSILGSNEPLYVIDGFPVNGSLTHLNNSDIESVEVLKDASATAIYGSRGANGVVLITTKRGKAGKTVVDFETSFSSQKLIRKLDLMNAKEYAMLYNEQAINDNITPFFSQADIDSFGEGFDWQDFVFQRAPVLTSSLNVSGGNDKTQFSVSGSFFGQQGIVKGSNYNRYAIQSNVLHNVSEKFKINFSTSLSRLMTERKDSGGGSRGNSMINAAISAPPTLTPFNEDGSYRVLSTAYPFIATDIRNPINFINEQSSQIKANVVLANLALMYNFTPDLMLKISGGIENRDERTDNYTTTRFFNSQGSASVSAGQFTSLLNENTLNYNKTFGEKHSVSAVAGFTYQDFLNTSLNGSGTGFLSNIFESNNLGASMNPGVPGSGYSKSLVLSYLGRVNYVYNDKYLVTVSMRRDGSSRYSEGHKWGNFPSAALAWRVSNEEFMRNNTWISDLKVRTSWGLTGSQAIDPYSTLNQLISGRTIFNDDYANTFAPGTRLPGTLKWETTAQFDLGVDFGVLSNRLLITADFYNKNTSDLLSTVILPSSLGYTNTIQNVGKIQNRGVELGLDGKILTGAFTWDMNANISFNKSKVLSLYNGEDILRDNVGVIIINDATSILREGRPVGQFWGYREIGYDEKGDIIFEDINNDGSISQADKTYIGDPNPKFIYGLNSTMTFKNFEFNLFFQGSQGNDIFNASAITNTMDYGFGLNMPKSVYNQHWTPDNRDAHYPRISLRTPTRVSDRYIEDGSYLRLKNIMLAYNLPVNNLGVKAFRSLQIYASGQNLLTFTKYSWWDPETNFRLDHNTYPAAKSVTVGLRVGF